MNNISFFKALLMKELNEKDLPGNQEKIAQAAEPKDKITGADFKALRAKKGMKKEDFKLEEKVDMEELEMMLKKLKKDNPGKKVTYSFIKDSPKGYVFYIDKKLVKEGEDNNSGGGTLKIEKEGDKYYWTWNPKSGKSQKSNDGFESKADAQRDFMRKSKYMKESEGQDHEVSMAQNSLKSIISSASQLMNMLGQDEKDIPAWIQDHITNAENYINQASKNYHEYNEGNTGEYDMDELPDGTIEKSAGDAEDLDMKLQSMMEAKFSLKDFSKNLELHKKGDITKSQLITSYNKLNAKDQDKAKELAKDIDVLPSPKKTNEISLQSMMEDLFEAKKKPSAGLSKKQKSAIVKKAKSGKDMGKKGKGFEKIVKAAKKSGTDNPEAVAGAAFWKGQAKKAK